MKLKRSYTFLYMPDDHGESRLLRVPRWTIVAAAGLVLCLGLGTLLYGVGLGHGSGWLPGTGVASSGGDGAATASAGAWDASSTGATSSSASGARGRGARPA